jgi:hypothetical protein
MHPTVCLSDPQMPDVPELDLSNLDLTTQEIDFDEVDGERVRTFSSRAGTIQSEIVKDALDKVVDFLPFSLSRFAHSRSFCRELTCEYTRRRSIRILPRLLLIGGR